MATPLGSLLTDHPVALGDPLVHVDDLAHTKADVVAEVGALASQLSGVAPGSPVVVIGDGIAVLLGLFASWAAGLVARSEEHTSELQSH